MRHTFLKSAKNGSAIDCVYYVIYKISNIDNQLSNPKLSKNGDKYILLRVKDNSMARNESAAVFYFYKNERDVAFLRSDYEGRSPYIKVKGSVFGTYPEVKISSSKIVSAGIGSGIVFDTGDIYAFDSKLKDELLSPLGKSGIHIRHTSINEFQDNSDLIEEGMELKYERLTESPYDRYQINIFIDGLDEVFNVPAWVTPTMATLIDQGYRFSIIVSEITERDEDNGVNSGLVVTIKGTK